MKLTNEISSTEKLLNLIRSKDGVAQEQDGEKPPSSNQERKSPPAKSSAFGKSVTLGVDIGKRNLKLVKIDEGAAGRGDYFSYTTVTYPEDIFFDSPYFATFLGSEIRRFCNGSKKVNVWSSLPFDKVEIRSVNVPRVPRKQREKVILWTARKELAIDDNYVFDYDVKGEIIEKGVQKTAVMAVAAPKSETEKYSDLFAAAGYPLTGLTLAPFTIQNLLTTKWIPSLGTVAGIYIGWDFSRIDIFSKGELVAVRSVKTGTNGIIELLKEELDRKFSGVDVSMIQAERMLYGLSSDYKGPRLDREFDLTEEEALEMIKPALGRIVTQLEMTFKNYQANLESETVGKIFISSVMPFYKPIMDYMGEQIGIESEILDPIPVEGRAGSFAGMSVTDRSQYALCLGLALSDNNRTPNLLFTYKDKKDKAIASTVNKLAIAVCALLLLAGGGYFSWQKYNIDQKEKQLVDLQSKLNKYGSSLDQNTMVQLIARLKQQKQTVSEYLDRYRGIVVLGEISTLTSPNIKLLNLKSMLKPVASDKDKDPKKSLSLEGIVTGSKETLEAGLADYVAALKSSPLFSQANIEKKNMETYRSENVLHFNIDLKLS